ncbi:probable lipid-A-disaccharide synthase, mitochondrial isoform X2 [Cornus florida]|uniref:probable lipid-A-disaccharide synthase, mitochondrial isoform X2 n=1 Tax=Cornus florida TaxID=4283 RepID=UPI00289C619F|nr:probable lipid-A-disaccharide synthase, mitochondrial isoform X2 [Cornus florida]
MRMNEQTCKSSTGFAIRAPAHCRLSQVVSALRLYCGLKFVKTARNPLMLIMLGIVRMLLGRTRNLKSGVSADFLWLVRRYISVSSRAAIDMAAKDGELRVFIVSGEVSGDTIGSRLMMSLKKVSPFPVHFAGVGGSMMSKQRLKSLFPMEDIAVMGIWELLPHLNKFRVKLKETIEAALLFRPHVVVTVDSKGFSFRLLRQLRARFVQQGLGSPAHFHYVAPSFWAWKGGEARLKGLSEFVDHVLCILPGEEEVCRSNGLGATFVGHPTLEDVLDLNLEKDTAENGWKVQGNCEKFRMQYGIPSGATIISLLPGSRMQEVTRMLSIFSNTMKLLKDSLPELTVVVHVAPNQHVKDYISRVVHQWPVSVILISGGSPRMKYDAFGASRVALCTSGTVAMELQLARLPCVVAYRAHILTEWFICYKAKVPYISIPNILLNSAIIPEALFQACTPSKLASLLMKLIQNEGLREEQIVAADKVMALLCPSKRTIINSKQLEFELVSPDYTPSMIAASTVLYSPGQCH